MTTNKLISDLSAASALTGAELLEATQSGGSVQTTTGAVASLAATYSRTLAVASMTANAGGGTATAATGTLTLGSGTTTSTYANTPSLSMAHSGAPFGMDAWVRLKAFTGATNSNAQATFAIFHKSAALLGLAVRAFYDGGFDLVRIEGGGTLYTHYTSGLGLGGNDWLRIRSDGGNASLFTASTASTPVSGDWKLWWSGTMVSTAPYLASDYPNVALRIDTQAGTSGAITVQWGDVTVRDL